MVDGALRTSVTIDGYSIVELIGRGGMGAVYRGVQQSLGRPVAIKLLAPAFRDDEQFNARFQREASLQATLQHPNIVPVFESGEAEGAPYIIMRLVEGPSLRQLIGADAVEPSRAVELLTGIAEALDFAHERGVLHRDVKPHNILIERGQHAWLADFGLTRMLEDSTALTGESGVVGTFDYLAPEIARGENACIASDVYSLAVTTFQALTGSLPFEARHHAAALFAHADAPRPRATQLRAALPAEVDGPLQRGMSVDAGQRQASAGAFLDDVRQAFGLDRRLPAHALPVRRTASFQTEAASWAGTVTSDSAASPSRTADRGRRLRIVAVATLLSLAVASAIAFLLPTGRTPARASTRSYPETVGGESHTWTNYRSAGGRPGSLIPAYATVKIACKVRGFEVPDRDTWWYRIASSPWNGNYYVSADAFYNNGRKSGSLVGTPFVDPTIPNCR